MKIIRPRLQCQPLLDAYNKVTETAIKKGTLKHLEMTVRNNGRMKIEEFVEELFLVALQTPLFAVVPEQDERLFYLHYYPQFLWKHSLIECGFCDKGVEEFVKFLTICFERYNFKLVGWQLCDGQEIAFCAQGGIGNPIFDSWLYDVGAPLTGLEYAGFDDVIEILDNVPVIQIYTRTARKQICEGVNLCRNESGIKMSLKASFPWETNPSYKERQSVYTQIKGRGFIPMPSEII